MGREPRLQRRALSRQTCWAAAARRVAIAGRLRRMTGVNIHQIRCLPERPRPGAVAGAHHRGRAVLGVADAPHVAAAVAASEPARHADRRGARGAERDTGPRCCPRRRRCWRRPRASGRCPAPASTSPSTPRRWPSRWAPSRAARGDRPGRRRRRTGAEAAGARGRRPAHGDDAARRPGQCADAPARAALKEADWGLATAPVPPAEPADRRRPWC